VPLSLSLLVPQQDKNPSKDRHFALPEPVSGPKIRSLLQQRG